MRNHVATSPLLQKSGVHQKQDIDVVRMRERKITKQYLQKNFGRDFELIIIKILMIKL